MSAHFHPLSIRKIHRQTEDCVSVSFDVPEQIREIFRYQQGQSLTMRAMIGGKEIRRTYSICSSPLDNEWTVAIKAVPGGAFSGFANQGLKPGDIIEVMQPVGRFNTPLDPGNRKQYVAFAAGSGITPVLSLVKTTLATEPGSSFTLVYGNRTRGSIIFFEELEAIKNRYMDRFNLVHVLSRERMDTTLNYGRIDPGKLAELAALIDYTGIDEYFICGPEQMIFGVKHYLESHGVKSSAIHFELFTAPGQQMQPGEAKLSEGGDIPVASGTSPDVIRTFPDNIGTSPDAVETCHITVRIDGRSIDFNLPAGSDTSVLDAALQQGADLPYACKGGVCCTCKARLLEGSVRMDVHWGLEPEEIAQGFILSCQSHPLTERLVVDFDIK